MEGIVHLQIPKNIYSTSIFFSGGGGGGGGG